MERNDRIATEIEREASRLRRIADRLDTVGDSIALDDDDGRGGGRGGGRGDGGRGGGGRGGGRGDGGDDGRGGGRGGGGRGDDGGDPPSLEEMAEESGLWNDLLTPRDIPDVGALECRIHPDGRWENLITGDTHEPNGRHPLAAAVTAMHGAQRSLDNPLSVAVAAGLFEGWGPLFIGGGYGRNGPSAVTGPEGRELFLELLGEEADVRTNRSTLHGLVVEDKYNRVGLLRSRFVDLERSAGQSWTPLKLRGDSVGVVQLADFDVYPNDDGALKWGAHLGAPCDELLVEAMGTPTVSTEEHDGYVYSQNGYVQFRRIRIDGGNRTAWQFTGYAEHPTPGGPIVLIDVVVDDQGQAWGNVMNGGSAVTLWWNPRHPEILKDVHVIDSKYGGLALTCQPGARIADQFMGRWHHRHLVMQDTTWDNRTDDPGEIDGERNAAALTGAAVVEFRKHTEVSGDLKIGSTWTFNTAQNVHHVGRFLWAPGATIKVEGNLWWYDPATGKSHKLLEGSAAQPLRRDQIEPVLAGLQTHPVGVS